MLIAFNKPYGVLSQFTPEPGSKWKSLGAFGLPAGVYPVGRLDADSEGLLLLTDEKGFNSAFLSPKNAHPREYWVQVEGLPDREDLERLAGGVVIEGKRTLPARAALWDKPPNVEPRDPPIRVRKTVPDSWISIELTEGRNRQVRKMTAAIGHPTLRLIRARMGRLELAALNLRPGRWCVLGEGERALLEL
jgi:23S rRNA pseudouridine2457 synthase